MFKTENNYVSKVDFRAGTNSQTKAHSDHKGVLNPDHEILDDTSVDDVGWKIRKQEQWEG